MLSILLQLTISIHSRALTHITWDMKSPTCPAALYSVLAMGPDRLFIIIAIQLIVLGPLKVVYNIFIESMKNFITDSLE